ncbi:MAG: serine/threonine-protein kinase [candidate division Zixibacteria bacterium]|nr:serine/threonine-protein kinase [candidate division Zixibacteria bacterium]
MAKYSPYILFLLISVFVVILAVNTVGPVSSLQRSVNDLLCRLTASDDQRPQVVLVTIDQRTQNELGRWPWHYDLVGDLVAAVGHGDPKAIMLDLDLYENGQEDSAGYTQVLADQMSWVPNVVLPYDIALATFPSTKTSNPKHLFGNSLTADNAMIMTEESGLWVRKVFLPAERLLESNPRLGFDYVVPDADQVVRHQPMAIYYDGYYYPSLSLSAAAAYLGVKSDEIKLSNSGKISMGSYTVPVNDQGQLFVNYSDGLPFARFSASDLLGQSFDYANIKGKLVIIGFDDPGQTDAFTTPIASRVPELHIKAMAAENIINSRYLTVHDKANSTYLIILLVLGAIAAFVLTHIPLLYRMVVLAGSFLVLANVNYFMVASFQTLPNTMYIALQLLLFAIASPLLETTMLSVEALKPGTDKKSGKASEKAKVKDERRQILSAPVRELKANPADPANLKTTALDKPEDYYEHEKRNLDADVTSASSHTTSAEGRGNIPAPADDDIVDFEPEIVAGYESHAAGSNSKIGETGRSSSGEVDIKNLGRYQISGVLGKGAMGTVYRGIDPAINRPVALKTIRLDFVNDPAELEELKERLYREAQAAGKLSHPNIVTIYDVGSEGPLQYIAMEFLEGQTLENLIRKKVKFNYRIIAQIITQICQALDYAHAAGIVHRDIKPANIMVLSDYKIKVMDFGIARIDSNSMTKTGIAMGTPNYISPEQLKGVPIDRRADLFSLGVVMYEMLLGRRPFKGENITSLIYAILHNEPDKPSLVNPQIPLLFDHIISKSLKKNPAERYQKAQDIATDLHDFVESFVSR